MSFMSHDLTVLKCRLFDLSSIIITHYCLSLPFPFEIILGLLELCFYCFSFFS